MSKPSPLTQNARRLWLKVVLAALCGAILGSLAAYSLDDRGILHAGRSQAWLVYPGAGAALLALIALLIGNQKIRPLLKAVFLGMLLAMTIAAAGTVFLVNWGEATGASGFVTIHPLGLILFGIPLTMVLGGTLGLAVGLLARFRRRRWQFSVRGLLLLTALVGLVLCLGLWLSTPAHHQWQRRQATARIVAAGGSIGYENEHTSPTWYEDMLGGDFQRRRYGAVGSISFGPGTTDEQLALVAVFPEVRLVAIDNCWLSDEGLGHLLGLPQLTDLTLTMTAISDRALEHIGQLTSLRHLQLCFSQVDQAGLKHLARLQALEMLNLRGSSITDQGLSELPALPKLRWLIFDSPKVTDAGLSQVAKFPRLEVLYINGTGISDAGLATLGQMSRLTSLGLDGTAVTDAGLAHLSKLTQLQYLSLNGTAITDAALAQLGPVAEVEVSLPFENAGLQAGSGKPPEKDNARGALNHDLPKISLASRCG